MIVSVISLVALMLASTLIMDTEWGPPLGALLLAVCAVVAATGVMSIAGATARTAEQAGAAQSVVAVSIGFLVGPFVPLPSSDERSEARRVGKEGVSTCRTRGSSDH